MKNNLYNGDYEEVQYCLTNFKNYGIYANAISNKTNCIINVPTDITINNIDDHIHWIFNILKDGIDTDYIHNIKIRLVWENNINCNLNIFDYWLSLFMWSMVLKTSNTIRPYHIFLGSKANILTGKDNQYILWELKRKDIQTYIDKYILTLDNKINIGNVQLNQIIADALWNYSRLEHFAFYLANTINNEDDIEMMRALPQYNEAFHTSLANIPLENVKDEGMKITWQIIDMIKNSEKFIGYEHGLTNSFRSSEAINPRQFKEAVINIGTKPNNQGGIFPQIIDKNFKIGGVNDPISYFIESSTARSAQIFSKINVGDSGDFARLLGLNNTDTILNNNPNYDCMSQHFIKFIIKSKNHLSMIKGRYYRDNPRGIDKLIDKDDMSLIGKTIYLHSPITCASNSSGHGICKKCYGVLYWTNYNINIGKIAAEILSSQLTQRLLSAKHLLETMISGIKWNAEFKDYMIIDMNSIKLNDDILEDDNLKKYTMIIDPNDIQLVNEEEDTISIEDTSIIEDINDNFISSDINNKDSEEFETTIEMDIGTYNEYITNFIIKTPEGKSITFTSEEQQELYLSNEFNNIIRKKAYANEGKVYIPLDKLEDNTLFYIKINNNEISKAMNSIINLINKSNVTDKYTKDEAVQTLVDLIIAGDLDIDSIHLEVLLSNQIVDANNILQKPNWNSSGAKYKMLTLNQALTNNPSVIISLLYKDLQKVLYNPLTFSKNKPSFFDLFFCEQPQYYINEDILTDDTSNIRDPETRIELYRLIGDGNYKKNSKNSQNNTK